MEAKERKRSFDINKLEPEQADILAEQIGVKVREICDEAVAKANKLLGIYGMKAQMQISIESMVEQDGEKQS